MASVESASVAGVREAEGGDSPVTVQVTFAAGGSYECLVAPSESVRQLREATERQHPTPPATFLKLVQAARVLLDEEPVSVVDVAQPVFAIVTRETRLEVLLQACGGYCGYAALLEGGRSNPDGSMSVGPFPTILEVLEDMAGQPPEMEYLKASSVEGILEFSGRSGDLLLPSLACAPLVASLALEIVPRVTFSIGVNSNLFNNGLGVWLETSPLLDKSADDESGIPLYVYSGYGMDRNRPGNTVKFHPGMSGAQLRVEGVGGFANQSVGFTPKNFTDAGGRLHTLDMTLGADGQNTVCLRGTEDGQVWEKAWRHQVFDGLHLPAVYAWIDMGGPSLHVGRITLLAHAS